MTTLIIDTTVDACSVALARDGKVTSSETEARRRGHAEELIPMIQRITQDANIALSEVDHILVTKGPGTFTGVRVGISAARGLALAVKGATLWGVDTLQALALSAVVRLGPDEGDIIVSVIDARRGDLYAAIYRVVATTTGSGKIPLVPLMPPTRCAVEEMTDALTDYAADVVHMVGSGCGLLAGDGDHEKAPLSLLAPDVTALAKWVDVLCAGSEHAGAAPLYLRPPDAALPRQTALQMAVQGNS